MPQTTAADVTYVSNAAARDVIVGYGRVRRTVTVTLPVGANTGYPLGGIPLRKDMLGCLSAVTRLAVVARTPVAGAANMNPKWVWNGNPTAPTLVGYETADAAVLLPWKEMANTNVVTASSQVLTLEVEGY